MSDRAQIDDRFESLLDVACAGTLTEQQAQELGVLLESNAAFRGIFIDHIQLRRDIQSASRVEKVFDRSVAQIDAMSPQTPLIVSSVPGFPYAVIHTAFDYFSSGWPLAYMISAVLVGLSLLTASFFYVSHPDQIANIQPPRPSSPAPRPLAVARVTGMIDCEFSDPETTTFAGANAPLGRKYALSEGLMELTYDTGAKVILQGPCTYEVTSADSGHLAVGKLTARVEKKVASGEWQVARADNQKSLTTDHRPLATTSSLSTIHYPLFTISTPTATVTDLGTEFGVKVDSAGGSHVLIFSGEVELLSKSDKNRLTLRAGGKNLGASVDAATGAITPRPLSESMLVRRMPRREKPLELAVSQFDASTEGWRIFGDGCPCKHVMDDGPSGGCIESLDEARGPEFYFVAPAKFLGNASAAFDGRLEFALRIYRWPPAKTTSGAVRYANSTDVVLMGDGVEIGANLPFRPKLDRWNAYSIPLNSTGGWYRRDQESRQPVSDADIKRVLGKLWELHIRGEFIVGKDKARLDNVRLLPPREKTTESHSKSDTAY